MSESEGWAGGAGGGEANTNADASLGAEQRHEAMALRERLVLEARTLRAAIERVHAGTYGICTACAEPIAERRLLAQPSAELCVPCLSDVESRVKRRGPRARWVDESGPDVDWRTP